MASPGTKKKRDADGNLSNELSKALEFADCSSKALAAAHCSLMDALKARSAKKLKKTDRGSGGSCKYFK
jgi:hypothetical protein